MNSVTSSRRYNNSQTITGQLPKWGLSTIEDNFEYRLYPPVAHHSLFRLTTPVILHTYNTGDGTIQINGEPPLLNAKGPRTTHYVPANATVEIQTIHDHIEYLIVALDNHDLPTSLADIPDYLNLNDVGLNTIFSEIRRELLNQTLDPAHYLTALNKCIVNRLLRFTNANSNNQITTKETLSPAQLSMIGSYIERHISHSIKVNDLGNLTGLSRSHFSRAFANSTGIPAQQFILKKKINRTRLLLVNSTMSLADIGFQTGFSSLSHFSKAFKKELGLSPKQYRERLKR